MIIALLFCALGLILGFIASYNEHSWHGSMDFFEWVITIFSSAIVGVFGFLFGMLISLAFPAQMVETVTAKSQLVTIQDNSSVQGGFFLGSGYMEGKPCYNFYQANERGGKTLVQLDASKVEVFDNLETGVPHCLEYTTKPTDAFVNLFASDVSKTRYEIYVPKGTIKESFTLDAQ